MHNQLKTAAICFNDSHLYTSTLIFPKRASEHGKSISKYQFYNKNINER